MDLNLTGSNVTFEFLNLVVKHELELFKLLSLLLQVVDSLILVLYGVLALLDFTSLRAYLLAERISLLDQICQLLLLLVYILLRLLLLRLSLLVVVGHQRQLGLALHARVDDLGKLLLVLLLDAVDILPRLVLNVLPLFLVLGHQLLASFPQSGSLAFLLLELQGVLSLKVLKDLLVVDQKVVESLLELFGLLLLLVVKLLVALVICLLLVRVVLLATGQFSLVVSAHLTELVVVDSFRFAFGVFQGGLAVLEVHFLGFDVGLNSLDFLLSGEKRVLHASLILVLELLDARLQVINVRHVLVSFSLGDQKFVGEMDLDVVTSFTLRILVLDVEDAEDAIMT